MLNDTETTSDILLQNITGSKCNVWLVYVTVTCNSFCRLLNKYISIFLTNVPKTCVCVLTFQVRWRWIKTTSFSWQQMLSIEYLLPHTERCLYHEQRVTGITQHYYLSGGRPHSLWADVKSGVVDRAVPRLEKNWY